MSKTFQKWVMLCVAVLTPLAAVSQSWVPTKTMTITVAMAPGSSNDLIARTLSEKLSRKLGQAVVVENRPGGSGVIGVASVARAPADGHTIGIAPSNIYMTPILTAGAGGKGFDVLRNLTPIITAGSAPVIIVANPSIGVKTPQDLLAFLRSKPMSYASPGAGSPMHVAGELLQRATGVQLSHAAYRGVLPATQAVIAGEVPIGIVTLGGIGELISAGKIVPVATVEKQRSELLPNLPTLSEVGIHGVETSVFYQIVAPAGTPAAIIARLNSEIRAILTTPELKERLRAMGVQVTASSAAEASALARDTYARNRRLVKEFNITAE